MPQDAAFGAPWLEDSADVGVQYSGSTGGNQPNVARSVFDLFISRRTAERNKADARVREILEALLPPTAFELTVIDVGENPERAKADRVFVTPTLIRRNPGPEVRAIGDLSNQDAIRSRFALT